YSEGTQNAHGVSSTIESMGTEVEVESVNVLRSGASAELFSLLVYHDSFSRTPQQGSGGLNRHPPAHNRHIIILRLAPVHLGLPLLFLLQARRDSRTICDS